MRRHHYLWLVLLGGILGLALAVLTFPIEHPPPWSTVLYSALGAGVVIGVVGGLVARWQKRRRP